MTDGYPTICYYSKEFNFGGKNGSELEKRNCFNSVINNLNIITTLTAAYVATPAPVPARFRWFPSQFPIPSRIPEFEKFKVKRVMHGNNYTNWRLSHFLLHHWFRRPVSLANLWEKSQLSVYKRKSTKKLFVNEI